MGHVSDFNGINSEPDMSQIPSDFITPENILDFQLTDGLSITNSLTEDLYHHSHLYPTNDISLNDESEYFGHIFDNSELPNLLFDSDHSFIDFDESDPILENETPILETDVANVINDIVSSHEVYKTENYSLINTEEVKTEKEIKVEDHESPKASHLNSFIQGEKEIDTELPELDVNFKNVENSESMSTNKTYIAETVFSDSSDEKNKQIPKIIIRVKKEPKSPESSSEISTPMTIADNVKLGRRRNCKINDSQSKNVYLSRKHKSRRRSTQFKIENIPKSDGKTAISQYDFTRNSENVTKNQNNKNDEKANYLSTFNDLNQNNFNKNNREETNFEKQPSFEINFHTYVNKEQFSYSTINNIKKENYVETKTPNSPLIDLTVNTCEIDFDNANLLPMSNNIKNELNESVDNIVEQINVTLDNRYKSFVDRTIENSLETKETSLGKPFREALLPCMKIKDNSLKSSKIGISQNSSLKSPQITSLLNSEKSVMKLSNKKASSVVESAKISPATKERSSLPLDSFSQVNKKKFSKDNTAIALIEELHAHHQQVFEEIEISTPELEVKLNDSKNSNVSLVSETSHKIQQCANETDKKINKFDHGENDMNSQNHLQSEKISIGRTVSTLNSSFTEDDTKSGNFSINNSIIGKFSHRSYRKRKSRSRSSSSSSDDEKWYLRKAKYDPVTNTYCDEFGRTIPPKELKSYLDSKNNSSYSSTSSVRDRSKSPRHRSHHRQYHKSRSNSKAHRRHHYSSSRSRSRSSDRKHKNNKRRHRSPSPRYHRRKRPHYMDLEENIKANEERRVVYVGDIPPGYTVDELKKRFSKYGPIEDATIKSKTTSNCSLYIFGFITFKRTSDACNAIDKGNESPQHPKFDLNFGGRRKFCNGNYTDLDGKVAEAESGWYNHHGYYRQQYVKKEDDFAELLRLEQKRLGMKK